MFIVWSTNDVTRSFKQTMYGCVTLKLLYMYTAFVYIYQEVIICIDVCMNIMLIYYVLSLSSVPIEEYEWPQNSHIISYSWLFGWINFNLIKDVFWHSWKKKSVLFYYV